MKSRVTLGLGPGLAIVMLEIRQVTYCSDCSAFSLTEEEWGRKSGTGPAHLPELSED